MDREPEIMQEAAPGGCAGHYLLTVLRWGDFSALGPHTTGGLCLAGAEQGSNPVSHL
jgi:hypothetical protein